MKRYILMPVTIVFFSFCTAQKSVIRKAAAVSNISVNNTASLAKKSGFYNWTVFLQGDEAALNAVDHVEYLLDPTFRNPQVSSYNRTNNFSYSTTGWGEFEIKAKVVFKDGRSQYIPYWLRLQSKMVKAPVKTVFKK